MQIPAISFMLFSLPFTQQFYFWRDHNGATLLFHVIPVTAPYIEYIKVWVENFHYIIYVNYETYAKAMLCKCLSYFFAIMKNNWLPNQNKQLFWSVPPRWLSWKSSIVFIFMSSDHKDKRAVRFFSHLSNQTWLYSWLYKHMRWTNEVLFLNV